MANEFLGNGWRFPILPDRTGSLAYAEGDENVLQSLRIPLSVSHKILPEFREYERTSTVVVNAYLQPVMQRYLRSLEQRLRSSDGLLRDLDTREHAGELALAGLSFRQREEES